MLQTNQKTGLIVEMGGAERDFSTSSEVQSETLPNSSKSFYQRNISYLSKVIQYLWYFDLTASSAPCSFIFILIYSSFSFQITNKFWIPNFIMEILNYVPHVLFSLTAKSTEQWQLPSTFSLPISP